MHCFRAFLDSSVPIHHRGAPPHCVLQSSGALSRSERVRANISVFTLTVLGRLINAISANSIKSKQGIVTRVGCPRHVLTRTRTREQRDNERRGVWSLRTQAHRRPPETLGCVGNCAATLGSYHRAPRVWTPSHDAGDRRFYAR